MFNNKNILITGGTGSFGKAFVKHLLDNYKPKKVIIYSRDELKQFEMSNNLKKYLKTLRFFIGDIRDFERLDSLMTDVDYVVHAAALKQVPIAEYNPNECIKTNIHGAENVIKSSLKNKVRKVIALSTDKASSPINLYGATKLVSDKLFIAANNMVGSKNLSFAVVRYGNVVNSRGSVIPFFLDLKKNNIKTYPITHKDMTRFIITLDQGVNFVIQSFFNMKGGEIFVPKLPSIRILDLVKSIDPKGKIKIIGVRPGEKIHESMISSDIAIQALEFKNHYVIKPDMIFNGKKVDYSKDYKNNKGKKVKNNFEYSSQKNNNFLSDKQINKLIDQIKY